MTPGHSALVPGYPLCPVSPALWRQQQPGDLSAALHGPQHLPGTEQSQDWKHSSVVLPLPWASPLCTPGVGTAAADGCRGLLCFGWLSGTREHPSCTPLSSRIPCHALAHHSPGTSAPTLILPHLRLVLGVHRADHEATAAALGSSEPLPLHFRGDPEPWTVCWQQPRPGLPGGLSQDGQCWWC